VRDARPNEASRLRLAAGTQVVAVRRLRIADTQPMAIEEAVFDAALAPLLLGADLEHGSLHETLVAGGHVPLQGRARLGAEAARAEDAALLEIPAGSPLLVEKRVIHDRDGRPLELTESRYAGERYGLDVQFEVELARE
jgi:GntR family transcriptional regulator